MRFVSARAPICGCRWATEHNADYDPLLSLQDLEQRVGAQPVPHVNYEGAPESAEPGIAGDTEAMMAAAASEAVQQSYEAGSGQELPIHRSETVDSRATAAASARHRDMLVDGRPSGLHLRHDKSDYHERDRPKHARSYHSSSAVSMSSRRINVTGTGTTSSSARKPAAEDVDDEYEGPQHEYHRDPASTARMRSAPFGHGASGPLGMDGWPGALGSSLFGLFGDRSSTGSGAGMGRPFTGHTTSADDRFGDGGATHGDPFEQPAFDDDDAGAATSSPAPPGIGPIIDVPYRVIDPPSSGGTSGGSRGSNNTGSSRRSFSTAALSSAASSTAGTAKRKRAPSSDRSGGAGADADQQQSTTDATTEVKQQKGKGKARSGTRTGLALAVASDEPAAGESGLEWHACEAGAAAARQGQAAAVQPARKPKAKAAPKKATTPAPAVPPDAVEDENEQAWTEVRFAEQHPSLASSTSAGTGTSGLHPYAPGESMADADNYANASDAGMVSAHDVVDYGPVPSAPSTLKSAKAGGAWSATGPTVIEHVAIDPEQMIPSSGFGAGALSDQPPDIRSTASPAGHGNFISEAAGGVTDQTQEAIDSGSVMDLGPSPARSPSSKPVAASLQQQQSRSTVDRWDLP